MKDVKKEKDPFRPMKRASAYLLFRSDYMRNVSGQGLSMKEMNKNIHEQWKSISDANRIKYEQLAAAKGEIAEREMQQYKKYGHFTMEDGTQSTRLAAEIMQRTKDREEARRMFTKMVRGVSKGHDSQDSDSDSDLD